MLLLQNYPKKLDNNYVKDIESMRSFDDFKKFESTYDPLEISKRIDN